MAYAQYGEATVRRLLVRFSTQAFASCRLQWASGKRLHGNDNYLHLHLRIINMQLCLHITTMIR